MAQCSNCEFHNMPGVVHCGRCGASLMLQTAAIDVYPPRATSWAKFWRKLPFAGVWYRFHDEWSSVSQRLGLEQDAPWPPWRVLWRLIVPGWAQCAAGFPRLGRGLMAGYVFSGILAVAFLGTTVGMLALAAMLTCHSISVSDVMFRSTNHQVVRWLRFVGTCAVLVFAMYYPAYQAGIRFVAPVVIQLERPPLHAGDVLLVSPRAYVERRPQPGDIVAYRATSDYTGRTAAGGNAVFRLQGQRIDRILAEGGQQVVWENGTLTVNGQPVAWKPLNPINAPARLIVDVPVGHYLIFPSTEAINLRAAPNEQTWLALSLISVNSIDGRVFWQLRPWSRMGSVSEWN